MNLRMRFRQLVELFTYPRRLIGPAISASAARRHWRRDLMKSGWEQVYRRCSFTSETTHPQAPYWWHYFKGRRNEIIDYLELGCWEGQGTVFAGWLFPDAKIAVADWFANPEAVAMFDSNISPFADRVEKIQGTTWEVLSTLKNSGRTFDLIYIDADHRFDGVILDTINSWAILRDGGYLVWDDYLWSHPEVPFQKTKIAIDAWLAAHDDLYEVIFAGYQVCIRKNKSTYDLTDMAFRDDLKK